MPDNRNFSLRSLFTLLGRVSRSEYFVVGLVLMLIKYGVEAAAIGATTRLFYTPLDFLSPALGSRMTFIEAGPLWLGVAWVVWTVAFVWIAVAMTLRRANDAGYTPWIALLILVPLLNFLVMIFMACVPTREEWVAGAKETVNEDLDRLMSLAYESPVAETPPPIEPSRPYQATSALAAAFGGLAVGVTYTICLMMLSVYGFDSYGAALFFGAPILTGAAGAYLFNRRMPRTIGETLLHSTALVLCCSLAFLLVGLEGIICIVMAIPIMAPLTLFGAMIGWAIAVGVAAHREDSARDDRGMLGCLLVLPLLAGVEPLVAEPAALSVATTIDIAAPPGEVWETVVAFPDIQSRPEWFFRWGIAAPERARIVGQGVGAVRYCEFTTGQFVEPITTWDPPNRLAFDVTEQPEPMFELTPYRHLHPPHLTGSFRSSRGEFQLIALGDGGTRLVGRTWYQLDIAPHGYWRHWTDQIVHRIHLRVLRHIKKVVEE